MKRQTWHANICHQIIEFESGFMSSALNSWRPTTPGVSMWFEFLFVIIYIPCNYIEDALLETLRIPSVWLQLTRLWCSPEFCEAYDGSGKKNRPAPCTPWIVATCSRDKSLGNIWGKVGNAKIRIENHQGSRDPMKTDVILHPDPYNLQKHIEALSSWK